MPDAPQILGCLADLPIAIIESAFDDGTDVLAVEWSKGEDGAPPDCRLVLARGAQDKTLTTT